MFRLLRYCLVSTAWYTYSSYPKQNVSPPKTNYFQNESHTFKMCMNNGEWPLGVVEIYYSISRVSENLQWLNVDRQLWENTVCCAGILLTSSISVTNIIKLGNIWSPIYRLHTSPVPIRKESDDSDQFSQLIGESYQTNHRNMYVYVMFCIWIQLWVIRIMIRPPTMHTIQYKWASRIIQKL